jgi:hypothetical protein
MSRCWAGLITVLALAVCASRADATVLVSASDATRSAEASFTISGTTLTILLTNTDDADGAGAPTVPNQVLTGLFFNLGTATFTNGTATLVDGQIIQTENCDKNCNTNNVGGEFSYASGGVDWLDGTTQGISSSGYLNANTKMGNLNGPNLDDPKALDGINFGIVPLGWDPYSGNGGLDGVALVDGTVQFVLTIPPGLKESDISNVYFTYGTSPGEGTLTPTTSGSVTTGGGGTTGGVPEPATLGMLGLAMASLGYRLRKRRSS